MPVSPSIRTAPLISQNQSLNTLPIETASGTRRLDYIDGLRGLAMLMVLFYHCWERIGAWPLFVPFGHGHDFSLLIPYGRYGVHLFLLLSGFCLYYPLAKKGAARETEPTLTEFARRRAFRILPPYYAALTLFVLVTAIAKAVHQPLLSPDTGLTWHGLWVDSIAHVVMVHNLFPGYVVSINGPFWSLALECQLYLLFPLIAVALRKTSPRLVILVCLAICVVFRSHFIGDIYDGPNMGFVIGSSVFFRFFEFALGMYAARIVVSETPLRALWPEALLASAIVGYTVKKHEMDYIAILTDPAWGFIFFALLLSARNQASVMHRVLSRRWLVWLGTISYSVYLVHLPLAVLIGHLAMSLSLAGLPLRVLSWVIAPALFIALGYIFHCLFERPFLRDRRKGALGPAVVFAAPPAG